MSIQLRRGTQAQVDASTVHLLAGQPLIATDTGELTIATASQVPSAGKKFVPMDLRAAKEYQLYMPGTSGTWTSPISGVTSPSTSGFVFDVSLSSMNYKDIRINKPSWVSSALTESKCVIVKLDSTLNRGAFGGGYNYLKIEHTVSGQNKAITYFVFNTYSSKLPDGDCYMVLSCGGGAINTSNTSTPTVHSCNVVEVVSGDSYLSRTPGVVYYDGTKMQAQNTLALNVLSVDYSLKVDGSNTLRLDCGGRSVCFDPSRSNTDLRISSAGDSNHYWDFPQQSGTLALLSDIQPEHEVMMSDQVTLNSSNMGQGSITINTAIKGLSNAEITGFIVQAGGRIYQFKLEDIYRVETTMGGTIRSLGSIFNSNVGVAVESLTQSYGSNTFNYTATFKFSANSTAYGVTVSAGFTYKGMAFANSGAY